MALVRRLALITTIATFLLIAVGASVRAAGAGLGCPDWPKCYGAWMPPLDPQEAAATGYDPADVNVPKAWIEYVNRVVGILIGFLIMGTAVVTTLRFRPASATVRKDAVRSAIAAVLLTGFQGWQGGQVVKEELAPLLVTSHLMIALVIVALLLRVVVACLRPDGPQEGLGREGARWSVIALAAVLIQVVLGALVRGGVDQAAKEMPGAPRSAWLAEVGDLDIVHRVLASAVVVCVALAWRAVLPATGLIGRVAAFNALMVTAQLGAGVALVWGDLPPVFQVVHVLVASLLAGGLYVQYMLTSRPAA